MTRPEKSDPHYNQISAELMRALRGRRSQEAFARRLSCSNHTIYTWEAGRNFPTAARMFAAAAVAGVDSELVLRRFYRQPPDSVLKLNLATASGVAELMDNLRGTATIGAIAESIGRNRFAVARWIRGTTQPRLPDFLRVVEATTLRVVDFIVCLVDPQLVPSIAARHRSMEAMRKAAYDLPWSHAILRALELEEYQRLPEHQPGWIADWLDLPSEIETRSLILLEESGQVVFHGGHYHPCGPGVVDTRTDPERARDLRLFFSEAAVERLRRSPPHMVSCAYNLFGVSRADLERLRNLQRAYFRQMRAIIAESEPVETIGLVTMLLADLRHSGTDQEPQGEVESPP